jgi:hypothetical protein
VYLQFSGSKLQINFLGTFDGIFLHQVKELIFSGPHGKFQPKRTNGFEVTTILSGQKGVYLVFFGVKFKINYLSVFDWIFLHQVKELIFSGPHAKFQL